MTLEMSDVEKWLADNPDLGVDGQAIQTVPPSAGGRNPQGKANNKRLARFGGVKSGSGKESEADFATWFEDMLRLHGWKYTHFRPGMTSRTYTNKAGETKNVWVTAVSGEIIEDYFRWHEEKRLFALDELKSEKGELSAAQKEVIASHRMAGIPVNIWRPADRPTIERILRGE